MRSVSTSFVFAAVVLVGSAGLGVEIIPPSPVPLYTIVRVKHNEGSQVFVLTIRDGNLAPVDVVAGREMLIFTGPPGSYAVFGVEDGQQFMRTVVIGSNPGPSPPGPQPDPEPSLGLVIIAREAKARIAQAGMSAIPSVAANFLAANRGVAERRLTTKDQIREFLKVENRKVLAGKEAAWNGWLLAVGYALDDLEDKGRLGTVQAYGRACQEIYEGLSG